MSRRRAALAGLVAGCALALTQALLRLGGVPLASELGADRVLPQLPVKLFILVIGFLGGPVAAKREALAAGFAGALAAGALMGWVYALVLRHPRAGRRPLWTLVVAVLLAWLGAVIALGPVLEASYLGLPPALAAATNGAALLLQFAVYAAVLWVALPKASSPPMLEGRRMFLVGAAGLTMALATGGMAAFFFRRSTLGYDGLSFVGPMDRITTTDMFYVVTKNIIDPQVSASTWRLHIGGRVAHPATFDLEQMMSMPGLVEQEFTLECISNEVGRGLISNALWRGLRLRDLLAAAGPLDSAVGVTLRAVDGYTHSASLASAMNPSTLVALEMNGRPLSDRHGYPARVLVPGAYGEVSVKWLTEIEVVDHTEQGYYESQGWQPNFVETFSRVDVPAHDDVVQAGTPIRVRGVAYAADRRISAVEVSTDGGSTWAQATVEPGPPHTWNRWSLDWTPTRRGPHLLEVRAYDGRGQVQKQAHRNSVPAGVTGTHKVPVVVS